jgi:hypothetical protein
MSGIKRRAFITLVGGAAAWPLAARGQQAERMRHIGVLLPATPDDLRFQTLFGAFLQGLALLGWSIGRNVRIDPRWATPKAAEIRRHAAELAAVAPEVIMAPVLWGRCCRRPAPCRLCSRSLAILSAPASSRAWRGRAATPPAL